jgi:large subunit ribosomal protein L13
MTQEQKEKAIFPKTPILKKEKVIHDWFILDASGKTLGRLASEISKILRGKHSPTYTPHVDGGDGVIIINAEKVKVTGNKEAQKVYRHHTGFIGNLKEIGYRTMLARKPGYIIEHAVKGMMPKNRLTRKQMKRLRVFAGENHNMQAQQPVNVNI